MLKTNFTDLIDKIYQKNMKIKKIKILNKNFIFIFDYLFARQILLNKENFFAKNEMVFNKIKPITGKNGLVQMQGDISREYRSYSKPIFVLDNIKKNENIISFIASNYVDKIENNKPLDVSDFIMQLVLEIAFRVFLGFNINNTKCLGQNFLRLNELCGKRMMSFFCFPLYIPTLNNLKINFLKNNIRNSISEQIELSNYNIHSDEKNVVNLFKNDNYLIDQCMTFLFAGHETAAASITFTLLLLAEYPYYQEQIYKGDDDIIKNIYKESLRLYPPAYMLVRQVKKDTIFNDFKLHVSDQIIICVKQIQQSERYFYKPQDFFPERFLQHNKNEGFMPFGMGEKSCLGEKYAYLEAITILREICKKFIIKKREKKIEYSKLITLHPKQGQFIWLQKR